tara:strand:- start:1268 stop:2989 length:1722 start_codon:yes stop_codon:yes gene_type:complete
MKIIGMNSEHDTSFAVLEGGIPIFHAELERYTRNKEEPGDCFAFLADTYPEYEKVKNLAHCVHWRDGKRIEERFPESFAKIVGKDKVFYEPGHHEAHAANAFFSSNFDEALIVTMDGGGHDYLPNNMGGSDAFIHYQLHAEVLPWHQSDADTKTVAGTAFTLWHGKGNKIYNIFTFPQNILDIGGAWTNILRNLGMSIGPPYGNQAGTLMAMASMGDLAGPADELLKLFLGTKFSPVIALAKEAQSGEHVHDYMIRFMKEKNLSAFDLAAALQRATEITVKHVIAYYSELAIKNNIRNLCLSGGVALNSVMTGKMFDWYGGYFENIYIPPVPYDAGLSIGAAQWVWHQAMDQPRVKWDRNASPYLGELYGKKDVNAALQKYSSILGDKINTKTVKDENVVDLLDKQKIVSVFGGRSESGRRALGNRSILADPRAPDMKDKINKKVKHRQHFRPFAPSILREDVAEWFVKDIESPYMSFVIKFREEMQSKVPAVVHVDGTARLQTVTEKDNFWFYNFLKKWKEKTKIPILLNTSFNDREPIVETPEDAIKCFLKTDIDFLYFYEQGILVGKGDQ